MRGDLVIVKAYGEKPLIRRIWNSNENVVYITNDEQFQLLIAGKDAIEPIGFPREDVFKYDQKLATSMERLHHNKKWDWNKLKSW